MAELDFKPEVCSAFIFFISHRIWLVRCLRPRSQTLWSGSPGPLAPHWTSAPARCGSGDLGTVSLCSSHWRLSPGPHTPLTAGWQHLRSIQSPPRPPPPHRQPHCHSLNRNNTDWSFSLTSVSRHSFSTFLQTRVCRHSFSCHSWNTVVWPLLSACCGFVVSTH